MPSGMKFQLKTGFKNQAFDISTQTANGDKSFMLLVTNKL